MKDIKFLHSTWLYKVPLRIYTRKVFIPMVMKVENTQVQMRKGNLEFCILHIISRGEVYASDMLEELTSARIMVVEGTLYPLLTRLKTAGLLEYRWVESKTGPPRKYYKLTTRGRDFLRQLDHTWGDLLTSTSKIIKKKAPQKKTRIKSAQA